MTGKPRNHHYKNIQVRRRASLYIRLLQALRHGQVFPMSERRDAGCTNVFYKKRRDNG